MQDVAKHEDISRAVSDLMQKTSDSLTSETLKLLLQRNNLVECLRGALRYPIPAVLMQVDTALMDCFGMFIRVMKGLIKSKEQ